MQSEKYRQLVDKLVAKTDRRELDWRESAHPDGFQVSFPNYSLLLRQKERGEAFGAPPPDIILSIVDMNGSVVDTIYNFEIDGEGREKPYYLKMRDLYRMVRQQVLGADKAVEEILSELGE
jgi:hypothetical protein